MDVPFLSSGAMSRAHYALVRKVETATSVPMADQYLLAEVEAIQERLAQPSLSVRRTKECLITLLYCTMTLSHGMSVNVDFALRHAINLAEAGQTVQNKRIGYLYCVEMMPKEHEMQLMLVNTLRKDLESSAVPRICLALETLIQAPSQDVIPAVQDRLFELLSHSSVHVRRRALLAFSNLATYEPEILGRTVEKIRPRLKDTDPEVVSSALTVTRDMIKVHLVNKDKLRPILLKMLRSTWHHREDGSRHWLLIKILQLIQLVKPSIEELKLILDIIHTCSQYDHNMNAVVLQCFLAASAAEAELLREAEVLSKITFVDNVRHLLVSNHMNDIYLFVSCLECIEARLWAGTTSEIPAVLEGWEVERVMKLLDIPDDSVRMKTLTILSNIDSSIVEGYYAQVLQTDLTLTSDEDRETAARRLLEISDVFVKDGEGYAQAIKELLAVFEKDTKRHVLQSVVEHILSKLRNADTTFRSSCLGVFFALLGEGEPVGQTLAVVLPAVACEYLDHSPLAPSNLLKGLASQLLYHTAAKQEACLLSMIRVAANVEITPDGIVGTVTKVREQAGRHIKKRCDQFLDLSHTPNKIKEIVLKAKSPSLPDFLMALEVHLAEKASAAPRSPLLSPSRHISPERSASQMSSHNPKQLRYAAYEAPKHAPRLHRRLSSTSIRSNNYSEGRQSPFLGAGSPVLRTISPGDLALAVEEIQLQDLHKVAPADTTPLPTLTPPVIDEGATARDDLIALDSPFITDPPMPSIATVLELDFETVWNTLSKANLRGWCEPSVDIILRRVRDVYNNAQVFSAEDPPFNGDMKVLFLSKQSSLSNHHGLGALRLRRGEDNSCLWHLRCEDSELRTAIQAVLNDE